MKSLAFFLLLLTGCASQVINLSILEPAEYSISGDVKRISILPVAGYPGRSGQFDSLGTYTLDTLCDYNKVKLAYIYGIHDVFSKSPRFASVRITDTSFLKQAGSAKIDKELIRRVCLHDTTDAVLLVLKVVAYDFAVNLKDGNPMLDENKDIQYIENLQDDYARTFIRRTEGSSKDCVFIYRLISNFKIGVFDPNDFDYPDVIALTEVFDMYRPGECKKFRDKKAQKELLYNSCFFTGNQVGNRLTPLWKDDQKRPLYKDINPYLLEANDMAVQDNWNDAAELWQSLAYNHRPGLESKACYNMAIKSELEDDLDMSLFWINRADSLRTSQKIKSYRSVLEERIKKRTLLDQQMQ